MGPTCEHLGSFTRCLIYSGKMSFLLRLAVYFQILSCGLSHFSVGGSLFSLEPLEFHRAAWVSPCRGRAYLGPRPLHKWPGPGPGCFISSYLIFLGSAFLGELSWELKTSVPF